MCSSAKVYAWAPLIDDALAPEEAEQWGDMLCLLGLYGCLERARFAVDPLTERFYFGPAADAS